MTYEKNCIIYSESIIINSRVDDDDDDDERLGNKKGS